jgi:hypothetical protein
MKAELLPEDIRGEKSFESIKGETWDEAGPVLAKSFVNAEKMLGGRIPLPTKPEEVEAFRKDHLPKLYTAGVLESPPDKPENYGLTRHEKIEEETFNSFLAHAHKSKLPKSVVAAVLDWYGGYLGNMDTEIEKTHTAAVEGLKKEFGAGYDEKVAIAQRAVGKYASPALKVKLDTFRLGDDPDMVKMWVDYAMLKNEDGVVKGSQSSSVAGGDVKTKIAAINNNPQHAYWNEKDPGHKAAVEEMSALYRQLT